MDSPAGMLCELPCLSELSAGHPRSFALPSFYESFYYCSLLSNNEFNLLKRFCITDKCGNLYQYHDTGEGDGAD